MNYNVDEKGYYGDFGGAYIPEMLYPNVAELRENYLKITAEPDFKKEFERLQVQRIEAFKSFHEDTINKKFDDPKITVGIDDKEYDKFLKLAEKF